MACCHPSISIGFNNIVLETLSSSTIVSIPQVSPNFCSGPNQLYNGRHQSSGILTWNWQQKASFHCSSTTLPGLYFLPENKLFLYLNFIFEASNLNRLFMKCETAMSLQYWFHSSMECSLPMCNICCASASDTPLDSPALLHFYSF